MIDLLRIHPHMRLYYPIILFLLLTSCYTQKSITTKKEPITNQVLQELQPGKVYVFQHNNGIKSEIQIESVSNSVVMGQLIRLNGTKTREPFKSSYEEILLNIHTITTRKFNLPWTIATIGLTSGVLIWFYSDIKNNFEL